MERRLPMAQQARPPHSLLVRLAHWLLAVSAVGLISSGWAIFNAAPFYDIAFPPAVALGGGLTGALRWHFAFMWTFAIAVIALIAVRLVRREAAPALLPVSPGALSRETRAAIALRLGHRPASYVHLQRAMYLGVLGLAVVLIASGLALWKPVQLAVLADILGGYEMSRRVHFWAMAALSVFVVVHVVMVAIVPATLKSMLFGAVIRTDAARGEAP